MILADADRYGRLLEDVHLSGYSLSARARSSSSFSRAIAGGHRIKQISRPG
jgi:hypothetical protein